MIRDIRYLGDPVLRTRTAPVVEFDDDLRVLVEDMIETMYDAEGIGLAAPQVGDPRSVTVIDVGELRDGTEVMALINPRVVRREGGMSSEEGCLSIPGVVETIERSAEVEVEYLDQDGKRRSVVGREVLSRVLQHEIDHLDGVLFIDHLGSMQREIVVRNWRRMMEEKGLTVGGV